jgi:hypothetical protein
MEKELTARGLATKALNEALASIDVNDHPGFVREGIAGFHGHINEALAASAQLDNDRAELAAKHDLLPAAGAARLAREAQAEAEARASTALSNARQSTEVLRRAGLLGAQPQVDKDREALARAELAMIVGEGTPDQLALRVAQVASTGSRDAVSVLGSDYGRALLSTKGLEGRDLEAALDSAKRIIVESALDNPGRHTEAELKAAQLYHATGELDAAVGAASFALGSQGITA